MKNIITIFIKKSALALLAFPVMGIATGALTSCADMLDTKSDMVEFAEDNTLNTPEDSLSSVLGVIQCMQKIADRTVLFGELRADLMTPSKDATTTIQRIAANDFSEPNAYNKISDYYAVINNCNYFIENVDTTLARLGKKIFEKEYAAVKTYRAWTYLQAVKTYGRVPLVLQPMLTENDALDATKMKYSNITEICNFLIDDIKPYVDTELPQYGTMGGMDKYESKKFFIPVRILLGELCLWAGRYDEACSYFYNYLARKNHEIPTQTNAERWSVTNLDFATANITSNGLALDIASFSSYEVIAGIPMETNEFYGQMSNLKNIFKSTETNYNRYEAEPSKAMFSLSAAQDYCLLAKASDTQKDTVYAPKTGLPEKNSAGDLRLCQAYDYHYYNQSETSQYSPDMQTISKCAESFVGLYRVQYVYLMFAEALNRAGYPQTAFSILKYGLRDMNNQKYISEEELAACPYTSFSDDVFTERNTQGIHARGCGDVDCDTTYCIPADLSPDEVIAYVEDKIITEMALETAFEGKRFFDLMRVALRRNDPAYLADPVSRRNGEKDEATYSFLMNTDNWYLPIQ